MELPAQARWKVYGDPDQTTGHFNVEVFWSLVASYQHGLAAQTPGHAGRAIVTGTGALGDGLGRPGFQEIAAIAQLEDSEFRPLRVRVNDPVRRDAELLVR